MQTVAWLIPVLPLLGAAFLGLLGRRLAKGAVTAVALAAVAGSLVLAGLAFWAVLGAPGRRLEFTYLDWMAAGTLRVPFGLVFDPLSATMALVVAGIGALIHLYSVGYMEEEPGYARYFCYLNLFVFFMLTLVLGSSLPLLFVGWEGVGLCSYLLIGYAYDTEPAAAAGLKAFLYNRMGDLGMTMGMLALFAAFGTLTIGPILARAGQLAPETGFGILTFATLMMFAGATGKSAQIPLYLWLPDAMAGPTPVSALIHAATMVTAGIYLICRLAPLYRLAPIALTTVAWVGAATALFAALIGLFQRDIKKVLALHGLPAGLHVPGPGVGRVRGRLLPPVHPRLVQGPAVPGGGQRDPRPAPPAGPVPDGRAQGQDAGDLLDHGGRHPLHHGLPGHRRLLQQGRDPLPGVPEEPLPVTPRACWGRPAPPSTCGG